MARPTLSKEFIAEQRRRRILTGFAWVVSASTYRDTTVADISRRAGVARNTFYKVFASKEALAQELVEQTIPRAAAATWETGSCAWITVVELASFAAAGDRQRSDATVALARRLLEALPETSSVRPPREDGSDPLLSSLPPGRHGLPEGFVWENHHRRLLLGLALAVAHNGLPSTTMGGIVDAAAVSRGTFGRHFRDGGIDAASLALLQEVSLVESAEVEVRSGVGGLAVELAAALYVGDTSALRSRRALLAAVLAAVDAVPDGGGKAETVRTHSPTAAGRMAPDPGGDWVHLLDYRALEGRCTELEGRPASVTTAGQTRAHRDADGSNGGRPDALRSPVDAR